MKKSAFIALAMGLLTITACNNKKAEAPAPAAEAEVEVITDSVMQNKIAGDYTTPDQKTVITLNSDMTASVKNFNKEFYKWEFMVKPEGEQINIMLIRKGMDSDIKEQAIVDLTEDKIVYDNETFRKAAKK